MHTNWLKTVLDFEKIVIFSPFYHLIYYIYLKYRNFQITWIVPLWILRWFLVHMLLVFCSHSRSWCFNFSIEVLCTHKHIFTHSLQVAIISIQLSPADLHSILHTSQCQYWDCILLWSPCKDHKGRNMHKQYFTSTNLTFTPTVTNRQALKQIAKLAACKQPQRESPIW